MTPVASTDSSAAINNQLELLKPIIDKARSLYNSNFLTASIWITAEGKNGPIQELLHFPCSADIPPQLKDFFADYCLLLVSLQQQLQKDLTKHSNRKNK